MLIGQSRVVSNYLIVDWQVVWHVSAKPTAQVSYALVDHYESVVLLVHASRISAKSEHCMQLIGAQIHRYIQLTSIHTTNKYTQTRAHRPTHRGTTHRRTDTQTHRHTRTYPRTCKHTHTRALTRTDTHKANAALSTPTATPIHAQTCTFGTGRD